MKKMVAFDDLDGSEAEGTYYIGLGGEWREIDLTDFHYEDLQQALVKFWEAARPCEPPRKAAAHPAGNPSSGGQGRGRQWHKGFRAWADASGRTYTTASNSYYPKVQDVADYDAYLAAGGAPRPGEGSDGGAGGTAAT